MRGLIAHHRRSRAHMYILSSMPVNRLAAGSTAPVWGDDPSVTTLESRL